MNVILDTNIWVSFLFGKQLHTVADLFSNPNIHIYVSEHLISELTDVLSRPKVRQHISSESIEAMWTLIRERCLPVENYPDVKLEIRDAKDVYLLAMAKAIPADFIVTGDKDLLVICKYGQTAILTYNDFCLLLTSMHISR
ncbi:MAG: putative toxin-antitoxin system toxin component, PIN family [Paludibacteraceae bacterium]|nr:putative toxin-antitoxin system toxin component, PIN family [Paludibacteraceae bacterium]